MNNKKAIFFMAFLPILPAACQPSNGYAFRAVTGVLVINDGVNSKAEDGAFVSFDPSFAHESTIEDMRNVPDRLVVSCIGEDYFSKHYTFLTIEVVAERKGVVYCRVRSDNETAPHECTVVLENYTIIVANAVLERLEITINKADASGIAQENRMRADTIGVNNT